MGTSFRPLPVETVAAQLANLPSIQLDDTSLLSALRIALASAIASGQDAIELTQSLSAPSAWLGLDLTKVAGSVSQSTPQIPVTTSTPLAASLPPAWLLAAAQAGVQAQAVTRIAVLDSDPTTLTRVELPAWTIGQQSSATFGPVLIENADAQLTVQKWIKVYLVPLQMVSFVSGAVTLFVAPIAATGSAASVALSAGSVWLNVASFASGSPANSFAGIAEQGGSITCDKPLTLGAATVTLPAGASLTLTVTPVSLASVNPISQVSAPAAMTFSFPAAKTATAAIANFSASAYAQTFACKPNGQIPIYNDTVKTLAFPCVTDQTQFKPVPQANTLLSVTGVAPLVITGWALAVTQSAPATLGTAENAGFFYLGFGLGISVQWSALNKPEPQAGGIILVSSQGLALWTAAGLAPNTISQFKVELWNAQNAPSLLAVTRLATSTLVYEFLGTVELITLGAIISASLDRPLLADGTRTAILVLPGLCRLSKVNGKERLLVAAAFPAADIPKIIALNPNGFPMALDNALIQVSVPLSLLVEANLATPQPNLPYVATSGNLLTGFLYEMDFPFLPDPYTGLILTSDQRRVPAGLFGAVNWTATGGITLRMADLQHAHPAQAPTSEASSGLPAALVPPPVQLSTGIFQIGLTDANPAPIAVTQFPFQFDPVTTPHTIAPRQSAVPPPGSPAPAPATGLLLLDVSTRASQLGVEIVDYNAGTAAQLLTIDGLSARTAAAFTPIITLPAISWEPMYNQSPPVADSPTNRLQSPTDDGPICGVGVNSATLVPVSPIQSLGAILAGTQKDGSLYGALLTLPYGMVAGIAQTTGPKGAPAPQLTQPEFEIPGTSGSVSLTGAYQLTLRPRVVDPNAPLFTGGTFLRTQEDNPGAGALSYGEQVLGRDVATIFSTQFNKGGVPVKRYDLTGYGASLFTDWTNLNTPDPTSIIQVDFVTTVGRTSHEIIQAQSVIYPWGIKVVRTITIDRLNSGSVERTDSGWIAASDGKFTITTPMNDLTSAAVHAGVIDSLLKVRNVREFGLPLQTPGTFDYDTTKPLPPGIQLEPQHAAITMQPVTFDSEIAINPQHNVLLGGSKVAGLDQQTHTAVPSAGIIGYIGLTARYHLSLTDLLGFLPKLPQPAGGPIQATINLGGSNNVFRSVTFTADAATDSTVKQNALVISTRGLPTLPSGSAWTVALKGASDPAPRALTPAQPIPVIQFNSSPGVPGLEAHFADPADIFRLAPAPPAPPAFLYGFLQDTTTQKTFLAQPFITSGIQQLALRQVPALADPGVLLGALSSFPAISSALPLTGLQNLASALGSQSLAIDKWFPTDGTKVTPLISTSVAVVDLVYRWKSGDGAPVPAQPNPSDPNAMIHVTLGQPSGPSWSIDIFEVALKLFIPPVDSSTPALWIEGSFHADSDSLPTFPNLQVVYDGPLAPITKFFTTLQKLGGALGGGSATPQVAHAHNIGSGGGSGLDVHFADGTLTVQDTFPLPQLPLGPGFIQDISLDLGASIDILNLDVGFLVGIGSPDAPVHWIVDPLSGTGCLQAGVQSGSLAVLIQLGIGVGLAIDLGIASGGASIVIQFQVQITGKTFELMLILTGQAQVSVLGGLASACISLSCGLGLQFPLPPLSNPFTVEAIGTASVAIHISICWVVSIDFSGSWSFTHNFSIPNPI